MNKKILRKSLIFILFISFPSYSLIRYLTTKNNFSEYILRSLRGPIEYDNKELIHYLKKKVLQSPSSNSYNLRSSIPVAFSKHRSQMFYEKYSKLMFKEKHGRFFVEAGAYDGLSMSNTLWLEMKQNWTGVLIEPDPANYIGLQKKNRKAWMAKACLSIELYPKMEKLSSLDLTLSNHRLHDVRFRATGTIVKADEQISLLQDGNTNMMYSAQCFRLESFLIALDVSQVDLLSLDVEGAEEEILRNFDFGRFKIEVIFLEWTKTEKAKWLIRFMNTKGFNLVSSEFEDFIFVRNDTEYLRFINSDFGNRPIT